MEQDLPARKRLGWYWVRYLATIVAVLPATWLSVVGITLYLGFLCRSSSQLAASWGETNTQQWLRTVALILIGLAVSGLLISAGFAVLGLH